METNQSNNTSQPDANDQHASGGRPQDSENWVQPEDMLDLAKGAAAMDKRGGLQEKVGGRTIGGAGAGPGTGDTGGDFDRPGTEGLPVINDFISPEGLNEDADTKEPVMEEDDLPQGGTLDDSPASGYPGGGAVRTEEDRIPPAITEDDNVGYSPGGPLNDPNRPTSGG